MPNLAKVLKEVVQRLARKEIKTALNQLRREAAEQKRALAGMQRTVQKLTSGVLTGTAADAALQEADGRARITAKAVVGMRKRLGLSQAALAKLLGLNTQTVYQWEHKKGALTFRGTTRERLMELRTKSRREVQEQLAGLAGPARRGGRGRRRATRRRRARR
ncbi:helix-turn-helix domain-containing protein [bacterium]|nr:helix-turn-helix domain-containing protein [bacterium]